MNDKAKDLKVCPLMRPIHRNINTFIITKLTNIKPKLIINDFKNV